MLPLISIKNNVLQLNICSDLLIAYLFDLKAIIFRLEFKKLSLLLISRFFVLSSTCALLPLVRMLYCLRVPKYLLPEILLLTEYLHSLVHPILETTSDHPSSTTSCDLYWPDSDPIVLETVEFQKLISLFLQFWSVLE